MSDKPENINGDTPDDIEEINEPAEETAETTSDAENEEPSEESNDTSLTITRDASLESVDETEELYEETEVKRKKRKPLRTILIIILIGIITMITAVFLYVYPLLKNMNIETVEENPEPTLNPEEVLEETEEVSTDLPTAEPMPETTEVAELTMKDNDDYGIINIAIFGMDNRYTRTILGGRSDVNIILTIDTENNEVRITSILRDTLIYIPSLDDYNRINTAIVYEDGPEGAVAAIEEEFLIDIDHYIVTSFRGMMEIVDSIGGVEVTLSKQEVWDVNGLLLELNDIFGYSEGSYYLKNSGTYTLNGIQSVAYMRIRKTGGVFERAARQQEVLASAKAKLAEMSLTEINTALETVTDWVKTDMEPAELVSLAMDLYSIRDAEMTASTFPYDGLYENVRYNGMAILQYEREESLYLLHDFIYYGIEPDTSTDTE